MSVNNMFHHLSDLMDSGGLMPSYFVFPIAAGYENGEAYLGSFDYFGSLVTDIDFVASGSGGQIARGVIESHYEEDMTVQEAKELCLKALRSAANQGAFTGEGLDAGIVTEDGVEIEREIEL